jgi:hypothetical protein
VREHGRYDLRLSIRRLADACGRRPAAAARGLAASGAHQGVNLIEAIQAGLDDSRDSMMGFLIAKNPILNGEIIQLDGAIRMSPR